MNSIKKYKEKNYMIVPRFIQLVLSIIACLSINCILSNTKGIVIENTTKIAAIIFVLVTSISAFFKDSDVIGDFNGNMILLSKLWVISLLSLFFAWTSVKRSSESLPDIILLISISFYAVSFWISYFFMCFRVLKIIHKSIALFIEKVVRSILVAITAWLVLFANSQSTGIYEYISIFVSTATAAYYPLLDMYKYTRTQIDEYEKEKIIEAERKRQEEIENESNGSKNYTV